MRGGAARRGRHLVGRRRPTGVPATSAVAGAAGSVAWSSPLTSAARSSNVVASPSGASTAHVPGSPVSSHAGSRSSSVSGSGASAPAMTSTTMTVMLSRPPWRLARATSSSAAAWGSVTVVSTLDDLVVADLVDEAVAAEQEAVVLDERQGPGVDADRRVDAEGPGHDVAAGVGACLVVGDVAGRHELLDVAVVDRDAAQPAVAHEVRPRVADVDEGQLLAGAGRRAVGLAACRSAVAAMTASAVTVVPMPCWSGLPIAAR